MAKKLLVANWKMNPQSFEEAKRLTRLVSAAAKKLKKVETVLCPPFVWLTDLSHKAHKGIAFGAQDIFWMNKGAFTGEISPWMLKNSKVSYVIVGHSERRRYLGETDEMIHKKVIAALSHDLRVILCIGETKMEHQRGQTKKVLRRQLALDLKNVSQKLITANQSLTIAYEPIWAIGTGIPETPHNANAAAQFIRQCLVPKFGNKIAQEVRILYGGSTDSQNIFGFMAMPEISGALVGSSSLNAAGFIKMLRIANET